MAVVVTIDNALSPQIEAAEGKYKGDTQMPPTSIKPGKLEVSIAPWGTQDFKSLEQVNTIDSFCLAPDENISLRCGELSFECEMKDFDLKKFQELFFGNEIKSLASAIRKYKRLGYRLFQADVEYKRFCELKLHAYYFYGCNIKRALRKESIKGLRIRHKTRNGYWVWMK